MKHRVIPENESKKILIDILYGFIELLKNGVIHRDLKPANILIDQGSFKLAGNTVLTILRLWLRKKSSKFLSGALAIKCGNSALYVTSDFREKAIQIQVWHMVLRIFVLWVLVWANTMVWELPSRPPQKHQESTARIQLCAYIQSFIGLS